MNARFLFIIFFNSFLLVIKHKKKALVHIKIVNSCFQIKQLQKAREVLRL